MPRRNERAAEAPGLRVIIAVTLLFLSLVAENASAQAVIKVDENVNFKLGVLLQPQADWTEDATDGDYQQNLFLRRARLLVGGQLSPNVTFFMETDSPNLGKVVAGTKTISTGFILQDAYVEWKVVNELMFDVGLMFIPLCRNCYQSAGTLLPIDYSAYSFLELELLSVGGPRPIHLLRHGVGILHDRDLPRQEEGPHHWRWLRRPVGLQGLRGRRVLRPALGPHRRPHGPGRPHSLRRR